MHTSTRPVVCSSVVAVALVLAGCTSSPGESTETVVMTADYPSYQTIGALKEDADLVVEVDLGEGHPDVMLPNYESDDPQVNPYAGTDEKPNPDEGAIPITVYSATVTAVHHGDVAVGDVIEVKEVGGVLDGVRYEIDGGAALRGHTSLLLFLATYPDSPASVLGGADGAFEPQGRGFRSLGDGATFLTVDEVNGLR